MVHYFKHVLCLVLTLASVYASNSLEFVVSNTVVSSRGGARFENEIGAEYAKQTLTAATNFIFGLLNQNNDADRKNVQTVSLEVENVDGVACATNDNTIHVSAGFIEKFPGDIKDEITGVIYHEMAHSLMWNGNGQAPSGLIEGIADFMRMKAGYAGAPWNPAAELGDVWDQGYVITAHFLDYLESIRTGFVADLNKMMRNSYSDSYFNELLGKPVAQLWSDYKALHATGH